MQAAAAAGWQHRRTRKRSREGDRVQQRLGEAEGGGGTRTVDQPQPSSGTQRLEWKLHAVRQGAERPQRAGPGGAGPSLHLLLAQSLGLGPSQDKAA